MKISWSRCVGLLGVITAVAAGCSEDSDGSNPGTDPDASGSSGGSTTSGVLPGDGDNVLPEQPVTSEPPPATGGSPGLDAGVGGAGGSAGSGAAGAAQAGAGGAPADGAAGAGGEGIAGAAGAGTGGSAGAPGDCALKAWWRAEGNAQDETGQFHGTLMNNAQFVAGQIGQAFRFDGTSAHVRVEHNEALNPQGSFTIEAWARTTNTSGTGVILSNYDCGLHCPGNSSYPAIFFAVLEGHPALSVRGQTQPLQEFRGPTLVADGQFHHLVGVRDVENMQLRVYVDGRLDAATELDPLAATPFVSQDDGEADPVLIGAKFQGMKTDLVQVFPGSIDEVALYFRALSDTEVAARYASPEVKCP